MVMVRTPLRIEPPAVGTSGVRSRRRSCSMDTGRLPYDRAKGESVPTPQGGSWLIRFAPPRADRARPAEPRHVAARVTLPAHTMRLTACRRRSRERRAVVEWAKKSARAKTTIDCGEATTTPTAVITDDARRRAARPAGHRDVADQRPGGAIDGAVVGPPAPIVLDARHAPADQSETESAQEKYTRRQFVMPIDRSAPILKTEALTKTYGSHTALDNLNLTVHRGEVFGYIGPNGAGKTTTFRILAGLLDPTSGKAYDRRQGRHRQQGPDQAARRLPAGQFRRLPDAARVGIPRLLRRRVPHPEEGAAQSASTSCLRIANAMEFRDKLMGALSRGMKQRVGIAKTLLHDPQVLILDEPAATIDPRARVQMRQLLRELADLGKAVLVSSHILPELADVCDTVGILSGGKLVAAGAGAGDPAQRPPAAADGGPGARRQAAGASGARAARRASGSRGRRRATACSATKCRPTNEQLAEGLQLLLKSGVPS